jgi:hypothetical protein
MLHLTTTLTRTILYLYQHYKIRNIRTIQALLTLWHPSLLSHPHTTDAESFGEEHLQDLLSTNQYVASRLGGIGPKYRDRVLSDKEKIIQVLVDGKCRDWVDVPLSKGETRELRGLGFGG